MNNKELHFIIKGLNIWEAYKFLDLSLYKLRHLRRIKATKSKKKKKYKQAEKNYKKIPLKSRKSLSRLGGLDYYNIGW